MIEKSGAGEQTVCVEWQPTRLGCTAVSQEGMAGSGIQHSGWWNPFVPIALLEISDIVICKAIPTLAGRLIKKKQL